MSPKIKASFKIIFCGILVFSVLKLAVYFSPHRPVVQRVRSLGGEYVIDKSHRNTPKIIRPFEYIFGDLRMFDRVIYIAIYSEELTQKDIELISNVKELSQLSLKCKFINDEWVSDLAKSKSVEYLDIYSPNITDESLKYLSNMKSLYNLSIRSKGITGAGFKYFEEDSKEYSRFETLEILSPSLTDEGLQNLIECPHIEVINVCDSQVTYSGVKKFLISREQLKAKRTNISIEGTNMLETDIIKLVKEFPNVRFSTGTRYSYVPEY